MCPVSVLMRAIDLREQKQTPKERKREREKESESEMCSRCFEWEDDAGKDFFCRLDCVKFCALTKSLPRILVRQA